MQTTNKTAISVRVLFFGAARDAAACEEAELRLNPPHDSASAFAQLLNAYPELRRFGKSLLFAVNQEYAQPDREIFDGDELAVFPPVSGGSENEFATETQRRGVTEKMRLWMSERQMLGARPSRPHQDPRGTSSN